jgi:exodeoxyribonuclease VII small subunit
MTDTFKASYGVLQKHAQTLRKQAEPNIDDLLSIVEESVAAYKVCQERIDAVEAALEKALGNAQQPPQAPAQGSHAADSAGAVDGSAEDDIPF